MANAANEVFVDTSGFFALLSKKDRIHRRAVEIAFDEPKRFVTSDAVISETCTLFNTRGEPRLCRTLFDMIGASETLRLEYINPVRFWQTRDFLLKHLDQDFSFVDCTSFVLMRELKLRKALATDKHFRIAGFEPLLA